MNAMVLPSSTAPDARWDAERIAQRLSATPTLPLPGRGDTLERWRQLAAFSAEDMALAKILEAHFDAIAILHDLGRVELVKPGSVWAVWAAGDPRLKLVATRQAGDVVRLDGGKPWCSGFDVCTHALVTCDAAAAPDASAEDRTALVAVDLRAAGLSHDASAWMGLGMSGIATGVTHFDGAAGTRVANGAAYLARPGFWHGGAGIAACWWGAAASAANQLRRSLKPERVHSAAQLGRVAALVESTRDTLRAVAARIDAEPHDKHLAGVLAARHLVKNAALEIVERVNDALGPGPLSSDRAFAQRCADLQMWVRQHHTGGDEAALGQMAHEAAEGWRL